MKLMTLKSNDFVDYFDVNEFEPAVVFSERNWCGLRAMRAKHLTNLDIDFGMLFSKHNPRIHSSDWRYSVLDHHGYVGVASYHMWNTKDGFIYDGQKQSKLVGYNLTDVDQEVMMIDASSLEPLMRGLTYNKQEKIIKFFKKSLFAASRYGIQNVYFRGFSWDSITGQLIVKKTFAENLPMYELRVNQYFSKYGAPVNK